MKRSVRAKSKLSGGRPNMAPKTRPLEPLRKALEAASAGNHGAAIVLYRQAIAQQPHNFAAHNFLGTSLREQGDLVGAIASYQAALDLQPQSGEVRVHLAETQRRLGFLNQSIENCSQVILHQKHNAEAFLIRGLARKERGDMAGAIADIRESTSLNRKSPSSLKILARVLMEAGHKAEALVHLEAALTIEPDDFETVRLSADCLSNIGRIKEAFAAYSRAIDLNPKDPFSYSNLSGMLCFTGQTDLAISAASIAVRLAPDLSGAHFNLALALESSVQPRQAIAAYGEALRCKPDFGGALIAMCRLRRHDCEWDGMETSEGLAQALTYKKGEPASPFSILPMASSLSDLLQCNSVWAQSMADCERQPLASYAPRPPSRRQDKIRIGYLSADFHVHATAALIAEVFELHDRSRFEAFGYSIGNRDESVMRRRLVASLDHFEDLNAMSHGDAARRIHADSIDILIDLKGYTFQARPQIVAYRPAPIQVNYLGYPSTMGASFVDYILADAIVAPFEHQPFFSEKIVHVPNSYQPNDRKREVAALHHSRRDFGLPEQGFVFCCFNANYKLNATIFDIWMRLLKAVPGSVLWLLESNTRAPDNLRREAAARGIDPARLVFASRMPVADHLARMPLGDLFLDTLPIGAHTTASEALWTGLPVLTCIGNAFPGRVGASLLEAVGMPELIAPDLVAYEEMALRLARNPIELAGVRTKLKERRATAALFDAARYTRNYEAALDRMMELREKGEKPRSFAIEE